MLHIGLGEVREDMFDACLDIKKDAGRSRGDEA